MKSDVTDRDLGAEVRALSAGNGYQMGKSEFESEAGAMKKQAISYLARIGIQKIAGLFLYAMGAGFTFTRAAMIYFVYLFGSTFLICLILFRTNEETLAQRGKIRTNSPTWDKILLPAFWILNYFAVYLLAGIAENGEHLTLVFWLGIVLISLAAWISTKATLENTFLESTARIQSDRDQKVCTTGPYRIVRHPAYCGLIINCIGVSMIFPYVSVGICMGATAVIIVIRTAFEDRMLKEGLDGYLEYARRTKYRLIPFVW